MCVRLPLRQRGWNGEGRARLRQTTWRDRVHSLATAVSKCPSQPTKAGRLRGASFQLAVARGTRARPPLASAPPPPTAPHSTFAGWAAPASRVPLCHRGWKGEGRAHIRQTTSRDKILTTQSRLDSFGTAVPTLTDQSRSSTWRKFPTCGRPRNEGRPAPPRVPHFRRPPPPLDLRRMGRMCVRLPLRQAGGMAKVERDSGKPPGVTGFIPSPRQCPSVQANRPKPAVYVAQVSNLRSPEERGRDPAPEASTPLPPTAPPLDLRRAGQIAVRVSPRLGGWEGEGRARNPATPPACQDSHNPKPARFLRHESAEVQSPPPRPSRTLLRWPAPQTAPAFQSMDSPSLPVAAITPLDLRPGGPHARPRASLSSWVGGRRSRANPANHLAGQNCQSVPSPQCHPE